MSRYRTRAAALFLLAAAAAAPEAVAQCVSAGEGQQMVAQGQVARLPDALQSAGLGDVQVLSAELCRAGSGWAYRVRFRQNGQMSSANIPAG